MESKVLMEFDESDGDLAKRVTEVLAGQARDAPARPGLGARDTVVVVVPSERLRSLLDDWA